MTNFTLSDLDAIIATRAVSDDEKSYTRKLIGKGVAKCAQKLGEEAVEAAIAAVQDDKEELTGEAADVLYHLLVVLKATNVPLANVMAELERRTAQTGLEEKAQRPTD
ncbi:phosphoribosyl-ATP diphosphatase [Roseibium sp. TrichSKD4]|uniref:phosphoribosyl-ATP diphosphatase n=1 Tax=Roseibium sp. TrichSKD4 TaxID=744980 RepID=UPI0001E56F8C|nr:phosphoribosyl-ATP diphosphatase [Roseibium sp. TrichSKD4]EFO32245.1 phosphoribosyl-ATP diphosphatase [Roseibium sp. TrichSKD4]